MTKQVYIFAGLITGLVIMAMLGLTAHYRGTGLERTQTELKELRSSLESNLVQITNIQEQLTRSQARVTELEQEARRLQQDIRKERETAARAQQSLEEEMRAELASRDVTISELQGRLTVNILDRVLFDSGEAVLKPEGEAILKKVAVILARHTNRVLHVVGHTDNVPIRPSARDRYPSNWELSTARATAAVRFLTEKAGVAPNRLGAIGYGEFHPVADNSTPEGRARNRRIEIVVLPEKLVPIPPDGRVTPNTPATGPVSTNAPPAPP